MARPQNARIKGDENGRKSMILAGRQSLGSKSNTTRNKDVNNDRLNSTLNIVPKMTNSTGYCAGSLFSGGGVLS